jgi:hypothetical protein
MILLKDNVDHIIIRLSLYLINLHVLYFFYYDVYYFIHDLRYFISSSSLNTDITKKNDNALLVNSYRDRVIQQCYTLAYFKTYQLILDRKRSTQKNIRGKS